MLPGLQYNINDLFQEAKKRWLKPIEVYYILQHHDMCEFTNMPLNRPRGGAVYLFNKRVMRFFRKDGHNWRKKKDGRTVAEAHERLKVGNVEALNCYYAHGEENRSFQRRSYWMLNPEYEHVVLVHYRDTNEGTSNSGPATQLSPFSQSRSSYTTQNPETTSIVGDSCEPNQNFSSPGSLEVTSDIVIMNNGMDHLEKTNAQAFRQLEEQLSLNDESFTEISPFYREHEVPQEICARPDDHEQLYDGYNGTKVGSGNHYHELLDHSCPGGNEKTLYWTEMLESSKFSSVIKLPEQHAYKAFENEKPLPSPGREMIANQEISYWLHPNNNNDENSVFSLTQHIGGVNMSPYSSVETQGTNSDYYERLFDQSQIQEPLDAYSRFAGGQKFTIMTVSPEYCYATEASKVIIIGSFLCLPMDSTWACMFGDVEVPAEILKDGVICCEAPSHLVGKVSLCITSGNKEPCSEVKEFEFRNKTNSCTHCNSLETEAARSPEELLLLVRFAEMLLSTSIMKDDSTESGSHLSTEQKADDDSWSHIIDALLVGNETSSGTIDRILQELLKDKLQHWLSCRSNERDEGAGCSLSKKEQGIIHMVSGLGFEWALNPILSYGVNVNFRDINGRTALHWAARFGREKMVASLIAAGAFAGAVTDPTSQDPNGKTAATIATSNGHKGLAGYLAEADLTSHLSSLTLEKCEVPKDSSELEAELTVRSVSKKNLEASDDEVSLKNTLGAVRNASQAAARIQAAFRAHSFKKRIEREAASATCLNGYVNGVGSIGGYARSLRDCNSAALSIQKKYRGWKGRKDFLALRQKVVKIQAHVRGYQTRKQYKVMIWAVGILDKVVLRWRRKRVGLRSSPQENNSKEESDDEDFLKAFRQEKVHVAIEKALGRVRSMVHSPHARQQYNRLLEMYRKAKNAWNIEEDETLLSTSVQNAWNIEEDDDLFQFPWETL
ncbi:calmodulin-binding transcription activator 4-like isoform X2 [Trifolium pratense]|uniref:calmodulin-binding transcription activator 4-like isoform X2 n=1 Tax=Trifolium pratense TaxID=57577 RepID=UPI001E692723|nr:calmodulin-binding transcription activator 4-like isoform X2 [Trifolium pratense]